MSSTTDAVEVSKSAEVESLAVVWEVRKSVYISFSLPSSSPDMDSGEDGVVIKESVRSAKTSFTRQASFCWVGCELGLMVLLGLSQGALATLGISCLPSCSSLKPEMPSPSVPPCCLTLPCRGSNRFLCMTLVQPPATLFTVYTGTPGVGWPTPGMLHSPTYPGFCTCLSRQSVSPGLDSPLLMLHPCTSGHTAPCASPAASWPCAWPSCGKM